MGIYEGVGWVGGCFMKGWGGGRVWWGGLCRGRVGWGGSCRGWGMSCRGGVGHAEVWWGGMGWVM